LWPYGESEISFVTFRGSTYTIWQSILLKLPDDDRKSDRNMLVYNNMC